MLTKPSHAAVAMLLSLLWTALALAQADDSNTPTEQPAPAPAVVEATSQPVESAPAREAVSADTEPARRPLLGRIAANIETSPAPHVVVLRISEDLLRPIIDKKVDRHSRVNDMILGTHVVGIARTRGVPTIALKEDSKQAVFQVVLTGTTTSRTTGRNGPAIIHSRTTTRFRATKQVVFEAGKGFYARPTKIVARTQSVTDDIDTTRGGLIGRLIERRAWRKVEENRAEVNRIAQRNAERRIMAAFDRQLEGPIARLNRAVDLRQTIANLRNDSWEPIYACCSTRDYLQIALAKEPGEVAPIELPSLHAPAAPLQLWLHKTLVGESIAEALTRFNETSTGVKDFLSWTLQAVPTAIGADATAAVAASASPQPSNFNYTTSGDWIVIQIGPATSTADQP